MVSTVAGLFVAGLCVAGLCGVAGAADGSVSAATFNTPAGPAYYGKPLFVADTDSQPLRRVR